MGLRESLGYKLPESSRLCMLLLLLLPELTHCSADLLFTILVLLFTGNRALSLFDSERYNRSLPPGEIHHLTRPTQRLGLILHLLAYLRTLCPSKQPPAAMTNPIGTACTALALLQFIPALQGKTIHRYNGYLVLSLALAGIPSIAIITPGATGGELSTHFSSLLLTSLAVFSGYKAWAAIRGKHRKEHRRWALRWMAYMTSIISIRPLMVVFVLWTTYTASYHSLWLCKELEAIRGGVVEECVDGRVVVRAGIDGGAEGIASGYRLGFGSCVVLALFLHAVAVEGWIAWTDGKGEGKLRRRDEVVAAVPQRLGRGT